MDMKVVENKRSSLSLPPLISQNTPWLILSHGDQGEKQTFYSISEEQYYTRMIPEMENKKILPSSSSPGWMVLMDDHDYFLFNLGTLEKIQLPFDTFDMDYDRVLMTATPPDGHIVFMRRNNEECIFQFCCPGDNAFSTETLHPFPAAVVSSSDEKIFLLKDDWSILIMEIVGSKLQHSNLVIQQIPRILLKMAGGTFKLCLVEHLGDILLVYGLSLAEYTSSWHYDFIVFRLDSSAMAWVEVEDLGEYAIFIDNQFCGICCPATEESGIWPNSIYHIPEQDGDEHMYVFSLKEGSTTTYLPCPTLSRQFQYSRWVMTDDAYN